MHSRGLNDARSGVVAQRVISAVGKSANRECRAIGVTFGTDAACYDAAGVPTVVFGPGSIDQAHTADEWVPLAEVEQAAEALYRAISDWSE